MSEIADSKLLDGIGWRILQELYADGRISYAELGRRVGLTTPAVVARYDRMLEVGIIQKNAAKVDPIKIGLSIQTFIHLSLAAQRGNESQVGRALAVINTFPGILVEECHRCTGKDVLILKAHFKSVQQLEQFIDKLGPCGSAESFLILSSPINYGEISRVMNGHAAH